MVPVDGSKYKPDKPVVNDTPSKEVKQPKQNTKRFIKDCIPHTDDIAILIMEKYGLAMDDKQKDKKAKSPKFTFEPTSADIHCKPGEEKKVQFKIATIKKCGFKGIDHFGLIPTFGADLASVVAQDVKVDSTEFGNKELLFEVILVAQKDSVGVHDLEFGLFTKKGALRAASGVIAKLTVA